MRITLIILAVLSLAAWPCAWDTDPRDAIFATAFPVVNSAGFSAKPMTSVLQNRAVRHNF